MIRGALRRAGARCTAVALLFAAAGCTARMAELEGERGHTEWISGNAGPSVDVPTIFTLRNRTWGTVRVESLRAPVGAEVSTVPPLPASIGPGKTMEVAVIGRFRREAGDSHLRILLESSGEEPLPLTVEARFQPTAPAGGPVAPQEIAPVSGASAK